MNCKPFKPTARYPHGVVSFQDHVTFLEAYYATRPAGSFKPSTKKGRQRGEIFHLRGALRAKHSGWQATMGTIRAAMKSKAEWATWYDAVFKERKEKLMKRRVAKGRNGKTGRKLKPTATAETGLGR